MTIPGLTPITAPPATPPVYGLLSAATTVEDDTRWQIGVEWAPEQMSGGGIRCVACEGNTDALTKSANPDVMTAQAFAVFAEDHCSTFGWESRDYVGRARRQLVATQSAKIAAEFQLGALRDSCDLDNVALVDGVDLGGPVTVVEAFALLEQSLGDAFDGARCMIHLDRATMTYAKNAYLLELAGQKWITANGTIVVADAGYRPVGGSSFMYGTSLVQVRLSPIEVTPPTMAEAMDRRTNDVTYYAQRLALLQLDTSEVAGDADHMFKIEVDTPVTSGS